MNIKNILRLSFLPALVLLVSGCYKEPDPFEDLAKSNGKVAQISVVWLGSTRTTTANTTIVSGQTVAAGASTFFNIEYTSLVEPKEFRVYWAPTATGTQTLLATIPAGTQRYDATLRNYVLQVPITAQAAAGTRVYFAEILSENNIVSAKKSAILTTTAPAN